MNPPQILTFGPNPDAPSNMRWASAMVPILKPGKTHKSQDPYVPGSQWLAVGATEEEARGKLEAVWLSQYPPVSEKRLEAVAKAQAARRKKAPEPLEELF